MVKITCLPVILLFFGLVNNGLGQSLITSGADFLKIPVSSRQKGMGNVFTGICDDINTIFYNPAGLSNLYSSEFSVMYNRWMPELNYYSISMGSKIRSHAIGLGVNYLKTASVFNTNKEKPADAYELAVSAGYSRKALIGKYNIKLLYGLSGKYIQRLLGDYRGSTYTFDVGLLVPVTGRLTVGAALQNISYSKIRLGTIKFINLDEKLPFSVRCGGSVKILKDKNLLFGLDYSRFFSGYNQFNYGGEYFWKNQIALRIGGEYGQENHRTASAGLGIRFKNHYQLDFSYELYSNETENISDVILSYQLSFSVKGAQRPLCTLLLPKNKSEITYISTGGKFEKKVFPLFTWEKARLLTGKIVTYYQLIVFTSKNSPEKSAITKQIKVLSSEDSVVFYQIKNSDILQDKRDYLRGLPQGTYYWRVKVNFLDGSFIWSEDSPKQFTVKKERF